MIRKSKKFCTTTRIDEGTKLLMAKLNDSWQYYCSDNKMPKGTTINSVCDILMCIKICEDNILITNIFCHLSDATEYMVLEF